MLSATGRHLGLGDVSTPRPGRTRTWLQSLLVRRDDRGLAGQCARHRTTLSLSIEEGWDWIGLVWRRHYWRKPLISDGGFIVGTSERGYLVNWLVGRLVPTRAQKQGCLGTHPHIMADGFRTFEQFSSEKKVLSSKYPINFIL